MYPQTFQIDLRGAPLKAKMKGFQRNTKGLMEYLRNRDGKKRVKVSGASYYSCIVGHRQLALYFISHALIAQ